VGSVLRRVGYVLSHFWMKIKEYGSEWVYTNVLIGSCYGVGDAELSEVIVSIYGFAIGRAVRSEDTRVTLVIDWTGWV
jgi:hypothetical protein